MTRPMLLDADDSILLLVDMQTRLGASMPAEVWASTRATAVMLARAADELDLPVVVTRQYPKGLGDTAPEIAAVLPAGCVTVDKTCFSSADADELRDALAMTDRSQVVVCGMEAHVCVLQTAAGLGTLGYAPFVVADGVCSRSPSHRDNALARLGHGGITVINRESCLFEWLRDARHEHFKAVTSLLP
ncbi:MAG: isochorismatase family protein [Halofilum sp. (in: g-proteobacteria)]